MYDIVLSDKASKQLKRLDKPIQVKIVAALEKIRIRPESYVTKLVGDPAYKLRVGDYRVIMDIDTGKLTILILKVGYRRNIYQDS